VCGVCMVCVCMCVFVCVCVCDSFRSLRGDNKVVLSIGCLAFFFFLEKETRARPHKQLLKKREHCSGNLGTIV